MDVFRRLGEKRRTGVKDFEKDTGTGAALARGWTENLIGADASKPLAEQGGGVVPDGNHVWIIPENDPAGLEIPPGTSMDRAADARIIRAGEGLDEEPQVAAGHGPHDGGGPLGTT